MKRKQLILFSVLGMSLLCGGIESALAQDFDIELEGFQEVPAVSTTGEGSFSLPQAPPFIFELNYDLEGEITQAHIHLGQHGMNGGVMIWLCANPLFIVNPPPATPECFGSNGFISKRLTLFDIIGPEDQGIGPGDLNKGAKTLEAMLAGVAYVNVHSTRFPGGEVRGQFRPRNNTSNGDIARLWEALDELHEHFEGHTHTYLTGRGTGHNNTEATSSPPEF